MTSILFLITPITINFIAAAGNAIVPDCVTPVNSLGKCINVMFCTSVMTALINNDHLTNSDVAQYLRSSQCGIMRDSHKVCCSLNDIDYGYENSASIHEPTTTKLAIDLQPPRISPPASTLLSNFETCGKLRHYETPHKWIGELWFRVESSGKIKLELQCLGTLITDKHLVVPAHCVASLPENITLDFVEIQGKEYSISKIFVHAGYNQPKYANDIAILKLEIDDDVEINDPVCLPLMQSNDEDSKSTLAIVKHANGVMKFGKAKSISNNECSSMFSNQQFSSLTSGQFCANIQINNTDFSEFLGAVMLESGRKRQYVYKGFTSTTTRNGKFFDKNKPYIFTNIEHHLSWIKAALQSDNEGLKNNTQYNDRRSMKPCQSPGNIQSYCVKLHQCSIYRDAPKPISRKRELFLQQIKCFTSSDTNRNNVDEDGVCCSAQYIELSDDEKYNVDQRFEKKGNAQLDMDKCGQVDSSRRIVGGTRADLKEFPWIGLIKYKVGRIFKLTCGSSLISEKYVLTCAHCITNLPSGYEIAAVRLGEHDLTTDPDCKLIDDNREECNPPFQDIEIEKLIPHFQYNTPRYANDIGLVKLAQSPDMSQGIVPICLPINNEMQQTISNRFTVAGFGFTENGRESNVLLKVLLPKVSKEKCQEMHSSIIQLSEGHQCYGGESIRDSCKGDSGNPLMNYVNFKGRIKAVQLGIVAAGHSDCGQDASGFPGIYTDVLKYMDWILDNIG
ncbi:CLUMA_CG015259, isoform A [Clunio marinus]|uniref:CLUMA_CG015259, isoform A n=1 Tax=Clunio marinus TaxID=568069 RepID=A0A1J1IQE2_9DIPT|nr:CLUMA_CG015259, isoform A [Clunio marinus]